MVSELPHQSLLTLDGRSPKSISTRSPISLSSSGITYMKKSAFVSFGPNVTLSGIPV